ncbi:RNA polymerase sigma factor [Streptomyces virginiae]|uniref:RNA polymerase sigma factor n=1 Tax=Streptomyces virginiae TaxID=1961 RepID=UPI00381B448D
MTEIPNSEQRQIHVIKPRSAPDAAVAPGLEPSAGVGAEALCAATSVGAEGEASAGVNADELLPRIKFFEDLPREVQDEFIALTRVDARRRIQRYFESRGLPHHDAEELTSAMYDILINALIAGKPVLSQRSFAYGIARNLLLNYWRQKKAEVHQILTDEMELCQGEMSDAEFDGFAEAVDVVPLFKQCTRTLTAYQVAVFYARSILDFPYAYLSVFFGKSEVALRVCHNSALNKIHADAIAIADLRLASRYSTYRVGDVAGRPKRFRKNKGTDSPASGDSG